VLPAEATPHRRGAFRLVALVVFEVFANFVVNALIKDLLISNYRYQALLGVWELEVGS